MVSVYQRPWTLATPVELQVHCHPFKKVSALFLKVRPIQPRIGTEILQATVHFTVLLWEVVGLEKRTIVHNC